ncbi:MAG TPA: phosphate ABC transporter ATP-binding protein PstB [Elusimicrobiota bacterium]|nr:phosphate ABC transporter ATP-binding protein PstB [Elusimicrobiota bacterium]
MAATSVHQGNPPAALETPKIAVQDLNLWYGSFHALKNVRVDVLPRKITAFIGPSGCGKSTVLRTFNRMNDLIKGVRVTGKVLIDDHNIYEEDTDLIRLRKRVGMVFQRPNPFPISVFENVAYGPRIHGETRRRRLEELVEKSLRATALWDDLKDRLSTPALGLSPEQQQRLCLSRLLAVEPDVLLMDEPCSALDPIATARIEELAVELSKDFTIVIVTHNMQQAARISHVTAFFLLGELLECGETSQIFTNPKNEKTEQYITGRFG